MSARRLADIVGKQRGKIPSQDRRSVPTIGGLSISQDRIVISDQPPPTGNVPPWVAPVLARVRHKATPAIKQAFAIARGYGLSEGGD